MKLHKSPLLCRMFNLAAAFFLCLPLSAPAQSVRRMSLTETYACSLNVWNREIRAGEQEVKLVEFHLLLRASFLGQRLPVEDEEIAPVELQTAAFRLKRLDLQYFENWNRNQTGKSAQVSPAMIDWDKLKLRPSARSDEEHPIRQFRVGDSLTQVVLHSTITMGRNDLMRIGVFEFQPEKVGIYELRFQLQRKNETTFDVRQLLEFYCPLERPSLTVLNAEVLHQMRLAFMHIPLVASTFFEPGSEVWNQNLTDRIFRSVFWGLTAKRMSCEPIDAQLLLLDDPTSSLSPPSRAALAARRAQSLLHLVEEKAALFRSGTPCKMMSGESNGRTNGHVNTSSCSTGIAMQAAEPSQSQVFIKSSGSEVSPLWFAEENRVVPLVASLPTQRLIFNPLQLKPLEESDYVELQCKDVFSAALLDCVQGAVVEVTNATGEKQEHEVSREELSASLHGEQSLRLDGKAMQDFLSKGEFTARLILRTSFADTAIASAPVTFKIERRSIVRDEVFALSPYDRVDLIYTLDHERLSELSREILQTVQDSLSANKPDIFVLITGHSDSLGEHRAGGLGRDYNLSLSFSRAAYLNKVLRDSLLRHAEKLGLPLRMKSEILSIPKALRESVSRNVNNPAILEVFNRGECPNTTPECDEQTLQMYVDMLIAEKVRHFRARAPSLTATQLDAVPNTAQIHSNVAAIRHLLPVEVISFEIIVDNQPRYVHCIGTGLGAAVPFYRRLEISSELQNVFCQMGFAASEIPDHFFGKDAHPAGRLMNRRVELNVIW